MSTLNVELLASRANQESHRGLQELLAALEGDALLFEPERLPERLHALDTLDMSFGYFGEEEFVTMPDAAMCHRARTIRDRIESANADVYKSIRSAIMRASSAKALLPWIQASARNETTRPLPGFGYDNEDEVLSGVLQLREPCEPRLHPLPEMVFYQPTPVRHILDLIKASTLSNDDVFVDIGSGLGHVALLASMLTGAPSIGIEIEPAYIASAQECARRLHLNDVHFICADARTADLSIGTVFYLYSPFTGSILADVLHTLRRESTKRSITVCALGPCTAALAKEQWLKAGALPDPARITVFHTCP
jgi:hypothetical protein